MNQDLLDAKLAIDKIIQKSRVHFYKPIQIAEILFQHRCNANIKLEHLEEYRNPSKQWRDEITAQFLGSICTSSARFQDDLFNENAIPQSPSLLEDFPEFLRKVIGLTNLTNKIKLDAHFHRVGVTNAADRGVDIIANFGSVIQVKHLSLSEQIAENITSTVTAHKIVIVCKNAEIKVIQSLLNQIGWHSRIPAIITLEELSIWYHRALRGKYANILGDFLLDNIKEQIQEEFPSLAGSDFQDFLKKRGCFNIHHLNWNSFM